MTPKLFALRIDSIGCEASLTHAKVWRILPDPRGAKDGSVTMVDESGEDYPKTTLCWSIPRAVRKKILAFEGAA